MDPLALTHALSALEIDYWFEVDHNWGREAHAMYAEAGVFVIDGKRMEGPSAVREFYRWREGRGVRTARHVVTNMRARMTGEDRARLDCILLLHAADGAPVLESKPAILIADVVADCVRDAAGRWRYLLHELKPVFMGGAPPTIPPGR